MRDRLTILLCTPDTPARECGNRTTALRWAGLLRSLGHRVRIADAYDGQASDVLVALHAVKSSAAIERFALERPGAPLVVALTGTDVYGDADVRARAAASLGVATRIVALQPLAVDELPLRLRDKARVIYQSASGAAPAAADRDGFRVCVVANARDVKDPFRAALAAQLLPASSRVRVVHLGAALDEGAGARARELMAASPRYSWLGPRSRRETLAILASSRLLVVSSRSEGGANVLSEAIACGVPVLASRIPGSVGILGSTYPGYFAPGDARALAALLHDAETDALYYEALRRWCARLAPLVTPEHERAAWHELLAELFSAGANHVDASRAARSSIAAPGSDRVHADFGREVREGLTAEPRRLPCRWLYDDEGSRLFEAICELPEYYPFRTERAILAEHAAAIASAVAAPAELVELGSGNAQKTALLVDALLRRQGALTYVPIDVARSALEASASALLPTRPGLTLRAIEAEYDAGLRSLRAMERDAARLLVWLGSNVGNFDRAGAAAFLSRVRATMDARDRFLLGVDLRKDKRTLERAYADSAGVTAQFTRNLLTRVSRELGGDFDAAAFAHEARYDEAAGRVALHLVATRPMRVRLTAIDLTIELCAGDRIHIEDSWKYSLDEVDDLARAASMRVERRWLDPEKRFCDALLAPV